MLEDWIDQLRSNGSETVWLAHISSKVTSKDGKDIKPRGDKLIGMWLRQLAVAALDLPVTGYLVARDARVVMAPLSREEALQQLAEVVRLWREGMDRPLPVAAKTALALLQGGDPRSVYDGGFDIGGENEDICLARLWPDFTALTAQEGWRDMAQSLYGPLNDWLAQHVRIEPLEESQDGGEEA
jgi:exodeoxyribonuclease V gamma subunit